MIVQDAAVQTLPAQQEPASGALWLSTVMPAITWMYGWVERAGTSMPQLLELEHTAALHEHTEEVRSTMASAQPDQLAACVWKALVALLTHAMAHFQSMIEPLRQQVDSLSELYADALHEIDELEAELDEANDAAEARRLEEAEDSARRDDDSSPYSPSDTLHAIDHFSIGGGGGRRASHHPGGAIGPPGFRKASTYHPDGGGPRAISVARRESRVSNEVCPPPRLDSAPIPPPTPRFSQHPRI